VYEISSRQIEKITYPRDLLIILFIFLVRIEVGHAWGKQEIHIHFWLENNIERGMLNLQDKVEMNVI
jgi:hypothetical protein